MIGGEEDWEFEAAGLIGPAEADVTIDPVALAGLVRDAEGSPRGPSLTEGVDGPLVLSLGDLLPDAEGSVVMLTDDSLPVNLITDEALFDSGIVDAQASAGGLPVEGLYYYSFANGLTLYSDTDIVIVNEAAGA